MQPYIHRTYEPLKFLGNLPGRLFFVPLTTVPDTPPLTYAPTWEEDGSHWGPTLVARIPFTRFALGVGVWLDAPQDIPMVRDGDAEYDAYVAVNGKVSREQWQSAREEIAAMGLDPDEEMELMQAKGVFE